MYGNTRGKPAATDLAPLRPREYGDFFTLWVCERSLTIIKIFGRFLKTDKVSGKPLIYDSNIGKCTYYFTAIIASLVPAAISYISQQERDISQIMVMASTNLLVSGCLVYFAGVEKVDLFLGGVL